MRWRRECGKNEEEFIPQMTGCSLLPCMGPDGLVGSLDEERQRRRANAHPCDLLPQISTTENWDSLVIWTGGSGYEEEPIYGRADYWDIEAA